MKKVDKIEESVNKIKRRIVRFRDFEDELVDIDEINGTTSSILPLVQSTTSDPDELKNQLKITSSSLVREVKYPETKKKRMQHQKL